jgi:hypothetical protein
MLRREKFRNNANAKSHNNLQSMAGYDRLDGNFGSP